MRRKSNNDKITKRPLKMDMGSIVIAQPWGLPTQQDITDKFDEKSSNTDYNQLIYSLRKYIHVEDTKARNAQVKFKIRINPADDLKSTASFQIQLAK